MKKAIIILIAVLSLASCASIKPASRIVSTAFVDFRKFTESGFMITPNEYYGEHETIGEIRMEVVPAMVETYPELKKNNKDGMPKPVVGIELLTFQEVAGLAVERAKLLGADAIVNFKLVKEDREPLVLERNKSIIKYVVYGLCIKRTAK